MLPAIGATLLAAAPHASANEVVRNESVGCADGTCVDSFEIKCTQASAFLCVDVTGTDPDPTIYPVTGFATAPSTMYGRVERFNVGINATGSLCFVRPGAEGTMKALVTVAAYNSGVQHPPVRNYRLTAECTRDFANALATRNTTVARKQNE